MLWGHPSYFDGYTSVELKGKPGKHIWEFYDILTKSLRVDVMPESTDRKKNRLRKKP